MIVLEIVLILSEIRKIVLIPLRRREINGNEFQKG